MTLPYVVTKNLSQEKQEFLSKIIKPTFDNYFAFTKSLSRSSRNTDNRYDYSNESLTSDLTILWAVFASVYQIAGDSDELAKLVKDDEYLISHFKRILEGDLGDLAVRPGACFWRVSSGEVLLQDALNGRLSDVLRTLRNGFAHSHWLYNNLTAFDYWKLQGWSTDNAHPSFDLTNRLANNYMLYIADANTWRPEKFWAMSNLRIIVTPATILRYHLHLFLNYLLNNSKMDIFGDDI